MESKIDDILCSFKALEQSQKDQQREMSGKLKYLEKEMAAGQEEMAQLVAKKNRRAPEHQSRWKGNEKQFLFKDSLSDSIQEALEMPDKIKNMLPTEATLLKSAKKQLL